MNPVRLLVGLGNPGLRYSNTRHNIGFKCVDHMARKWSVKLKDRRAKAVIGQGRVCDTDIALAKPRTYMNDSGAAVDYLMTRFAVSPEALLVVYDDIALPLGTIRVRRSGGDGGHNGVGSIIEHLGSKEFPRIRIGIGEPDEGVSYVEYVLGKFQKHEEKAIKPVIAVVADAVEVLLTEGIDTAMNRFN